MTNAVGKQAFLAVYDYGARIAERHFYDIDDEPAGVLQFMLEDIQRRSDRFRKDH